MNKTVATASRQRGDLARDEALKYSQQIIGIELETIRRIQIKAIEAAIEPVFDPRDRLDLIRSAWSIVDRVDATRQLLSSFTLVANAKRSELFKTARHLRNQMDHLASNIGNHNKQKHSAPVYGMIRYQRGHASDIDFKLGGNSTLNGITWDLIGLSETPTNFKVSLSSTPGVYISPIGETYLHAFDREFNLTDAGIVAAEIEQMLEEMAKSLEEQLKAHVQAEGHAWGGQQSPAHPLTLIVKSHFDKPEPMDDATALSLLGRCIVGPSPPLEE